jgi:hypothetical protein
MGERRGDGQALSRTLAARDHDCMLITVIEMSQSTWLVVSGVPKLAPDERRATCTLNKDSVQNSDHRLYMGLGGAVGWAPSPHAQN